MIFMKGSLIMRQFFVLLIVIVMVQVLAVEHTACYAGLKPGTIYVDLRKLTSRDAKKIGKSLNHPYPEELSENVIYNMLKSIHYKEKGFLKLKKQSKKSVFSSDEVRILAPLIADAFARVANDEYIIVYSVEDRILLSKLHTYCIMFITADELNVVFSSLRQKLSYNITESDKARVDRLFTNPLDTKKSSFWDLVPVEGQRLMGAHLNWLVMDVRSIPKGIPVARAKTGEQDVVDTAYASELEERVRRLETMQDKEPTQPRAPAEEDAYIRVDIARDYVPEQPPSSPGLSVGESEREELRSLDVKDKLKRLRALRDEGLITDDDYRSKKAQLILEEQKDKSIRERLKELRDMRDEGLINEKDYEALKKKLLDKWF